MKTITFVCKFLSDVVLTTSAATEGVHASLDFIPGAVFLGIVAKRYDSFKELNAAYDIFHSGKVRFSDGQIYLNGQRSFKTPLLWSTPKSEEKNGVLTFSAACNKEQMVDNLAKGQQFKQMRDGYFVLNGNDAIKVEIEKQFALKSAQDRETRRAKEGSIFGFESIAAGTTWCFRVDIDSSVEHLSDKIVKALIGEHHIGKSRSAQYGLVQIDEIKPLEVKAELFKDLFIYADSNLCFFNEFGSPTFTPTVEQLGFKNMKIDWKRSQIRTSSYSPYNQHRKNRDQERLCISKGSVFVLTGETPSNLPNRAFVGEYLNEGLGQVYLNPWFLKYDEKSCRFELKLGKPQEPILLQDYAAGEANRFDEALLAYLRYKKSEIGDSFYITNAVNEFVTEAKEFRGITKSQWGEIRNIAESSKDAGDLMNQLFNNSNAYLTHGVVANDWKEYGRCDKLMKNLQQVQEKVNLKEYTVLLASEMAKKSNRENYE